MIHPSRHALKIAWAGLVLPLLCILLWSQLWILWAGLWMLLGLCFVVDMVFGMYRRQIQVELTIPREIMVGETGAGLYGSAAVPSWGGLAFTFASTARMASSLPQSGCSS